MKEMNIPVQKIHFLRQVKKPDGGWKGVGKAVGKLWTPGSTPPPGREQQLRSHGRASAPLDQEKGVGRKSRRNRVSPKLVRRAGLGSNIELCFQLLAAQNIIVNLVL